MKFSKKQGQEADVSILDELIGQCESSMVSPFKKKKPVVDVEVKSEEAPEVADEDGESEGEDKPDLSDMDMSDLVELYKEIKARKGE